MILQTKRALAVFLTALLSFSLILSPVTAAAAGDTAGDATPLSLVAGYSSPAICTDTGASLELSSCSVQFEPNGEIVSGASIAWTRDGVKVERVTPAEPGIIPLTASSGSLSRTVYIVAKTPSDTEYVLYSNDYSVTGNLPADYRTVQQTGGTAISVDGSAEGNLVINASSSASSYIRVLLPSYLDAFGDAVLEARVRIGKAVDNAKWASIMYRVQNENYPYMQACMRYNTSAANGTEIAQRTPADAWSVTQKGPASATAGAYATLRVVITGKTTVYYINGTPVLTEKATPFNSGAFGFQARGCELCVDSVKVLVNTDSDAAADAVPGSYADVRDPDSNVALPPVIVSEIGSRAELDGILTDSPAIAVMPFAADGVNGKIILGTDGSCTPDEAMQALAKKVIPGFRVTSADAATALGNYLKSRDIRDAYVISDDASLISVTRSIWYYPTGAIDYTASSVTNPEVLRNECIASGARILLLSPRTGTQDNISYLQDRYLSVWLAVDGADASDIKASSVEAINRGASGLLTPDRAESEKCLTLYYTENTLTRRPNIIGHRGVPSLAQENSLAGAVAAFKAGATMVENDIYRLADNVLIVMHDTTLDRTTTGSGNVRSFTSEQLKAYAIDLNTAVPNEPIPTLEDYFKEFKGKGGIILIELKSDDAGVAAPLNALIDKYDIISQVVVISFHEEVIAALRKLNPGISAGYLTSSITLDEDATLLTAQTILDAVQKYETAYNPSYASGTLGYGVTRELFYRGVTVWPWTINSSEWFYSYFIMGTRGITTNYSQWSAGVAASLTPDLSHLTENTVSLALTSYDGGSRDCTAEAELVVVDDGGTGISYSDGKLQNTGAGTARFFFRVKLSTPTKLAYSLVTELISLTYDAPSTGGDSTEAGETTAPTTSTDNGTGNDTSSAPASSGDSGCGSSVSSLPALAAVILALTVAAVFSARIPAAHEPTSPRQHNRADTGTRRR